LEWQKLSREATSLDQLFWLSNLKLASLLRLSLAAKRSRGSDCLADSKI